MSKKELPHGLSMKSITDAVNKVAEPEVVLEMQIMPFSLHRELLEPFNTKHKLEIFDEGEQGVVLHVNAPQPLPLRSKPNRQDQRPAFAVEMLEFTIYDSVPVLMNSHLLRDVFIYTDHNGTAKPIPFDPNAAENIYINAAQKLPQSLVRTAEGSIYLSPEQPEALRLKIEQALFAAEESYELPPAEPDAPEL